MQRRFNEIPDELGYKTTDELRKALTDAGIVPPKSISVLVDEDTVEKWRRKLQPQDELSEPKQGVVRRRKALRPGDAPAEPVVEEPPARPAVAVRRTEAPLEVTPPVVEAAPVVEVPPEQPPAPSAAAADDANGGSEHGEASASAGVKKRKRFATVVTNNKTSARATDEEPASVSATVAPAPTPAPEPVAEPMQSAPAADVIDQPRRSRFATVVTHRETTVDHSSAPATDDGLGPEASASPTPPRSRFQTVHTTGSEPVAQLSPTEIAQLNRREADRNAGANQGGARVLGTLSREVLSERLDNDRRDFGGAAARPVARDAAAPATPADKAAEDRKRGKKGKRVVQQSDLYDRSKAGARGGVAARGKGGKKGGPMMAMPATRLNPTAEHKRVVRMEEAILVSELAMQMSVKAGELVMKLAFDLGLRGANINTAIDLDTATLVAEIYNFKVEQVGFDINNYLPTHADNEEDYVSRPPVLAVMGHVDHGKTSLLDAIRKTNVAIGEAGGITQHIGAYQVILDSGSITLLDTPGHEAFSALRARGAKATDIVIVVIAADDGIMPQTVEAIKLAQEADTLIMVALNKIDKPGADPERIKQSLTEYGLVPEEWGGTTIFVETSAKTGQGVLDLLEMVNLQAEVLELRANPVRPAEGLVIESKLDTGRGPVATVLVQQGTLVPGQTVVIGQFYGRVRTLSDDRGNRKKEANPSMPVEITGLNGVPAAGEKFYVVDSEKNAKTIAEHVASQLKQAEMAVSITNQDSMSAVDDFMKASQQKELKVIVKADVQGSTQALVQSLRKLSTEKVRVRVIHSGVGAIIENDINMAMGNDSDSAPLIIGFNTKAEQRAQALADQQGMTILTESVIYHILDQVTERMRLLLDPVYVEEYLGKAEIRAVFALSSGTIAGCMVLDGTIERNARCRVMRDGKAVHTGPVQSIRHHKDDVREIRQGFECGIQVGGFVDFREKDIIEAFKLRQVQAEL